MIEQMLHRTEVNSPSSNYRFVYPATTRGGEKNREMISLIVALMFKIFCQFSWSEYYLFYPSISSTMKCKLIWHRVSSWWSIYLLACAIYVCRMFWMKINYVYNFCYPFSENDDFFTIILLCFIIFYYPYKTLF